MTDKCGTSSFVAGSFSFPLQVADGHFPAQFIPVLGAAASCAITSHPLLSDAEARYDIVPEPTLKKDCRRERTGLAIHVLSRANGHSGTGLIPETSGPAIAGPTQGGLQS